MQSAAAASAWRGLASDGAEAKRSETAVCTTTLCSSEAPTSCSNKTWTGWLLFCSLCSGGIKLSVCPCWTFVTFLYFPISTALWFGGWIIMWWTLSRALSPYWWRKITCILCRRKRRHNWLSVPWKRQTWPDPGTSHLLDSVEELQLP